MKLPSIILAIVALCIMSFNLPVLQSGKWTWATESVINTFNKKQFTYLDKGNKIGRQILEQVMTGKLKAYDESGMPMDLEVIKKLLVPTRDTVLIVDRKTLEESMEISEHSPAADAASIRLKQYLAFDIRNNKLESRIHELDLLIETWDLKGVYTGYELLCTVKFSE